MGGVQVTGKQWVILIIVILIVINDPQLVTNLINQIFHSLAVFSQNLNTGG